MWAGGKSSITEKWRKQIVKPERKQQISMEGSLAEEHLVWRCLERVKICVWGQSWRPEVLLCTLKTGSEKDSILLKALKSRKTEVESFCFSGSWICNYTGKCALCLLPFPTICISSLHSAVHSLHLLFTLTYLLLKENGCAPGFQSTMEKDGV